MTINYTYTINSTNYDPGSTTFHFRVVSRGAGGGGTAGVVVDDFDVSSGTKTSDGNTTDIVLGVKEQTGTQGTRNFTLEVADNASFTGKVTLDFQVTDGAAVANNPTISPNTTSPSEGDTVTFTFGEAAGSNAATYYFQVAHGTTANADFTADPPGNGATARTTVTWNGTSFSPATAAVTLASSDGTDDGETFTGKLFDALTGGSEVATTGTITVSEAGSPTLSINPTSISNLLVNSSGGSCTAEFILQSDGDFTTAFTESTTGGANGESPSIGADNWAPAANHGVGFGDDYQVQVLAYGRGDGGTFGVGTLAGTSDLTASTSSSNNDGGGGWSNNASHWYQLDANFALEISSGTVSSASAGGEGRQVDIEIKEFDGINYGSGTTLLQHRVLLTADVDAT